MTTTTHDGRALGFLTYPYHRGGVTRWMADLATEWTRRGNEAWFIAPRPRQTFVNGKNRPTMLDLLDSYPLETRPRVVTMDVGDEFEFGTDAYRSTVYTNAIVRGVPEGTPILSADDASLWRAVAWIGARYPLIGVVHGNYDAYDRMVQCYGESTAAITCVSNRVLARTRALLPPGARPVERIICGVRLPELSADTSAPSNAVRLAWIGRMEERTKRVSDLPKIARALRDAGIEFTLEIMGDGPARTRLEGEILAGEFGAAVRLRGWGSSAEVRELLGRADLMLLTSNDEGMPVTVMEAFSVGCPVVSTRVSGIEDFETANGARDALWIYAVGDVDEAVRQIRAAHQVPRADRRRRARLLAESEFSIERCAERYESLLGRLVPGRALPRGAAVTDALRRFASYPVAAQRVLRLRAAGRYVRPARADGGSV